MQIELEIILHADVTGGVGVGGALTGLRGAVTCVGGGRNSHPFPDDEVHHCIQRKITTQNTQAGHPQRTLPNKAGITKVNHVPYCRATDKTY